MPVHLVCSTYLAFLQTWRTEEKNVSDRVCLTYLALLYKRQNQTKDVPVYPICSTEPAFLYKRKTNENYTSSHCFFQPISRSSLTCQNWTRNHISSSCVSSVMYFSMYTGTRRKKYIYPLILFIYIRFLFASTRDTYERSIDVSTHASAFHPRRCVQSRCRNIVESVAYITGLSFFVWRKHAGVIDFGTATRRQTNGAGTIFRVRAAIGDNTRQVNTEISGDRISPFELSGETRRPVLIRLP